MAVRRWFDCLGWSYRAGCGGWFAWVIRGQRGRGRVYGLPCRRMRGHCVGRRANNVRSRGCCVKFSPCSIVVAIIQLVVAQYNPPKLWQQPAAPCPCNLQEGSWQSSNTKALYVVWKIGVSRTCAGRDTGVASGQDQRARRRLQTKEPGAISGSMKGFDIWFERRLNSRR